MIRNNKTNKTKFQVKWLSCEDSNKIRVGDWAVKNPKDEYTCDCRICGTSFSSDKGFTRLEQHAKTEKHENNLFKLNIHQSRLIETSKTKSLQPQTGTFKQPQNIVRVFNPRDAAVRAELYWCLETVNSKNSLNSCKGKKELFEAMFPGCVPQSFSLSPTKASYLITEALGPYFKNLLLTELTSPNVYFTLQFDETSNVKNKKELQIRVRYWSNTENEIVNKHLITYFIGKADGQTLYNYLLKSLDSHGLSLRKVLTLGSDGPNVNKKVFRLFQENLKNLGYKGLIDIGTCLLHVAHNSFRKGLSCMSLDIDDFIIKVYYFFDKSDLRCEIYEKIQADLGLPKHKFSKHDRTRWLTLGPAAERILEQLPALEDYFLRYIAKKDESTAKKQNYLEIVKYLKDPLLKITLQFVVYTSNIFTREFTLLMQKEEPLIHILYPQLRNLIHILLTSIIQRSALPPSLSDLKIDDFLKISTNYLNLTDLKYGEKAKSLLASLKPKDSLIFLAQVKKFHVQSITHLYNKTCSLKALKYFQCLSPENIHRSESVDFILEIAILLAVSDIDSDALSCEWRLLQVDERISFTLNNNERIDSYWNKIFSLQTSLNTKYPNIKRVVQAALSLTHGSADVERGFLESALILTEDKSRMVEKTLNVKLAIIDGLKKFKCMPHTVPITDELLKLARGAHSSYVAYQEEQVRIETEKQKRKEEDSEREAEEKDILDSIRFEMRSVKTMESELELVQKQYAEAVRDSESMQNVLKDATNNNSSNKVVQEVLKSFENVRRKEREKRIELDKLRDDVQKRKSKVCEAAVNKKLKTVHTSQN